MKILLIGLLFTPLLFYPQISRKNLDYNIDGSKIVRRIYDKLIIFETDNGDITLTLYSDSISLRRQNLNILVCYPISYRNINTKLIIHYTDKTEEIVPNFPDIDNCSIYYFLNRLNFINYKKVKSITFLGIDKFELEDDSYFINFINNLN